METSCFYGLPGNADKLATLDVGTQYKYDFCEMKESSDHELLLSFMPFCDNCCALTSLLVLTAQCDDCTR